MAAKVLMPKIGISVETCLIGSWVKRIGDPVAVGDVLFNYETDKAVLECESTAAGTLLEIYCSEGDEVPVLTPVCVVGEPGVAGGGAEGMAGGGAAGVAGGGAEGADTGDVGGADNYAGTGTDVVGGAGVCADSDIPVNVGVRTAISPRAKNLAKRLGIDYTAAVPSGPHGRLIERDVDALARAMRTGVAAARSDTAKASAAAVQPDEAAATPAAIQPGEAAAAQPDAAAVTPAAAQPGETQAAGAAFTDEKLSKIRRIIAESMQKSLLELAQLTHHHSFDASKLLALRARFKQQGARDGLDKVTIGDIILYAVSRTLTDCPDFNAHLLDGGVMRRFSGVNLGVAMDTPRGLLVPTIFDADRKSLQQISEEVKTLAAAARLGAVNPDALSGGTFTVSNLGATGVEMFTPIINPPQVAILGVCGITERVRRQPDGGIETYPAMGLSLTYDHRAVDGAPASAFAQRLCSAMEHIELLIS